MSMRIVAALALAIAAVGLAAGALVATSFDPRQAAYVSVWLVFGAVGLVLAMRRPENLIGWIFLVISVCAELGHLAENVAPVISDAGGLPAFGWALAIQGWFITFDLLPVLLVLFPTGRPLSRRWWVVVIAAAVVAPVGVITAHRDEVSALSIALGPEVAGVAEEIQGVANLILLSLLFVGAASLVVRARSASRDERQQIKWVAFAGGLFAIAFLGTLLIWLSPLRALDPTVPFPAAMFGGVPFLTGLVAIPIAVGVAVLRYRLYEIDVLINRTIVYAAVSATLVATYLGVVILFQALLRPFTSGSELAVAGSTLLVVALFAPLRRRIQRAVDRRFYRSKYNAERTLDAFAARLREQIDLGALEGELLEAARETVQPAHASVWLRGAGR